MTCIYQTISKEASPLSVDVFRSYAKQYDSIDDYVIQDIIDACTEFGESYTGRSFRNIAYRLSLDEFSSRILLNRSNISSIESVEYLVSGSYVEVSDSIYYLKNLIWESEILLLPNEEWPVDLDDIEQGIRIDFTSAAYPESSKILLALKRHCLHVYMNRGDADDISDLVASSGASGFYNQFRIPRI